MEKWVMPMGKVNRVCFLPYDKHHKNQKIYL